MKCASECPEDKSKQTTLTGFFLRIPPLNSTLSLIISQNVPYSRLNNLLKSCLDTDYAFDDLEPQCEGSMTRILLYIYLECFVPLFKVEWILAV